jgi:hypothetical protein
MIFEGFPMAQAGLTVTNLEVTTRRADHNGSPMCGFVTFSDGKTYGFSWHDQKEVWVFSGEKKRISAFYGFYSAKRSAALVASF